MAACGRLSIAIACVVSSAALLWLSFPPADVALLSWVALVPLFLLLRRCGAGTAWLVSQAAGGLFSVGVQWWQMRVPAFGPLNFVLAHFAFSVYFGLFGLLAWHFHKKIPRWSVLTFPAAWVVLEYLRSHAGFLSWPWLILGYAHYRHPPLLAVASYAGVYGISFLVVVVNAALAALLPWPFASPWARVRTPPPAPGPVRRGAVAALGAVGAILLAGAACDLEAGTDTLKSGLRVSLIQGNAAVEESTVRLNGKKIFDAYRQLSRTAAQDEPAFIVWPESTVPGSLPHDRSVLRELAALAKETGAYLLVGTGGYDKFGPGRRGEKRVANSAFLLSPEGRVGGRYDKMLLLPFNEYYPLRGRVAWPAWMVSPTRGDSLPGGDYSVLRVGAFRLSVLICWENYFPEHFREMALRGADFIVSQTNESFTGSAVARQQMLAMNALRAAENGIYVLRAASTGVTAVIGPTGEVLERLSGREGGDVDVAGTLTATIHPDGRRSFYHRHGNVFFGVVCGFFALAAVASLVPHAAKRQR